jgi:membrane peptidoglycan carboxypeptidase
MTCPYCGQEHKPGTNFCPITGKRLIKPTSSRIKYLAIAVWGIVVLTVIGFLLIDSLHFPDIIRKWADNILVAQSINTLQPSKTVTLSPNADNKQEPVLVTTMAPATTIPNGETQRYKFNTNDVTTTYPYWTNYVRSILESKYEFQQIHRSGFTVYTTLDPNLQDVAQKLVQNEVRSLTDHNVTNGALVAIRPSTGEILAMVGSADLDNAATSGQVNMAVSLRQPGTSITPLIYALAFEKGWTPATLIWDVPSEFPPSGNPDDTRPPYKPVNYDGRFHGPVTVRSALANSYNIPAVKTLQFVGVYHDPSSPDTPGFIDFAKRIGITTLTRDDYGLSLSLGGGEVSLLELTEAYATLANGGLHVPPVAITKILDHNGNIVYQNQQPVGQHVLSPDLAYLITSILSDNQARTPSFGPNSVLNLPFPAAAKTGTTNDFRDNWTFGYSPDLAVGVWIGNTDFSPMQNTSGLTGAAPIWSEFMETAEKQLTGENPNSFSPPPGVADLIICSLSGSVPSLWCPEQRSEVFAVDQPPLPKNNDLWSQALVDTWTNLRSSSVCGNFTKEKLVLNITDPSAISWVQETDAGQAWAQKLGFSKPITLVPTRECRADDPHPNLAFVYPKEEETITSSSLNIIAIADADEWFKRFRLEYGRGGNPASWKLLIERNLPVDEPEEIYRWDLSEMNKGEITLRLYMESTEGTYAEKRLHLLINR